MPNLNKNSSLDSSKTYLLLKNNILHGRVLSNKTLSGSKIEAGHYHQVVFSAFVFYGCDAQDVIFQNCVFENCNFIFSHFRSCHFENCSFFHCKWVASSSLNSVFSDCNLDSTMNSLLVLGGNKHNLCGPQKLLQDASIQTVHAA